MKSPDVNDAFEQRARIFCGVLESGFGTGKEALRTIRGVLLPLYTAALDLPLPRDPGDDLPEDRERTRQKRRGIKQRLPKAGFQDPFWVVFYPLNLEQPEPVISTLSDCLANIWRDLKPGLEALDTDREKHLHRVLWEWRFGFLSHWGRHAIDALRAIHFQLEDFEQEDAR
ncbi:MAG TPA: DUF5063 domain-containing protein [Acidobacteriaceae bacterium]